MKISDKSLKKLAKLLIEHEVSFNENDVFYKLKYIVENYNNPKTSSVLYVSLNSQKALESINQIDLLLSKINPQWKMKDFLKNRNKFYEVKMESFVNHYKNLEENNDIILNLKEVLKSWSRKEKSYGIL